jgi:pimeloyl-ACP methyl ester carboxylesterase
VNVAGGSIYYVVRGTGPVLLLTGGGPSNADTLEPLASCLAGDFTVVTYDRRGYSRSQVSDQTGPGGIGRHADDARQLIAALGGGPVCVFGTSFGALIALELAAADPAAVAALVVHEPPLGQLLADGERPGFDLDLDSAKDASAALNAIAAYTLDLGRLRPLAGRLTVAGSEDSRDFYPYQCALRLVQQLGISRLELPGGHAGMISRPAPFAAWLRDLLQPRAVRATMHSEDRG